MAVPKKRTSKRRKGMRRAHDFIKYKAAITECQDCGGIKLSHHICEMCGYYRGIKILDIKEADEDSAGEVAEEGAE
ncbi:MAG: 50S ribosomal protein L32 [Myxococcota bacterium]|nr:50S ribosomal protein L32 [Myxococcota bacterium]